MAAEKKENETSQQSHSGENGEIRGRVNNSQNPAYEQQDSRQDISNVDQQEGNMNHGEKGADLSSEG